MKKNETQNNELNSPDNDTTQELYDISQIPGMVYPEETEEQPQEESYSEQRSRKHKERKAKKRRKRFSLLLKLLFTTAAACGLYFFASSGFFAVTAIEVSGNRFYTKAHISELSGIGTGGNIFSEDLGIARDRLLQDPYIRLAYLKRELPGTVHIEVEERTEYAAVPYGEQYILIDEDGLVLRLSDNRPVLPILEGMTILDMTPGRALSVEQAYLLTDTLEMISVMEENDLYFQRIRFSPVLVRAYIYDEYYCEGPPEDITNNMKRIHQLVGEQYKQGITRGVIRVGKGDYVAFDPQIEK